MSRAVRHLRRALRFLPLVLCGLAAAQSGCFTERAFPLRPGDVRLRAPVGPEVAAGSTRAWLRRTHAEFADLLPETNKPALLADDLVDTAGRPIDVFVRLKENPRRVHTIFGNFHGVLHSAQATGARLYIDEPAPLWPGCERIWVPVGGGLELAAQFGLARRGGVPLDADCIVILPGFLGDNGPQRSRDLSRLFLTHGLHVLGLEQRGAGQTDVRYPDVPYTFGVLETGDLLAVAEWLQAQPHVRRTGLIGTCWSANIALLAAWEDGRPAEDSGIDPRLLALQRPPTGAAHFEAGVIAISPTLRFEEFADLTARRWSLWNNAIIDRFQDEVEERQRAKGYELSGNLRDLVDSEVARHARWYPEMVADGYDYLRLLPYAGRPAGDKLERARVPALVLHAVNDPMGNAQDVADFIAQVRNPQVAALLLPGGGHLGFAAYAREYFYSLLINFFDPERGPAGSGAGAGAAYQGHTAGGATRSEAPR